MNQYEINEEFEITVDELDTETCWHFLAGCRFGRVGFVAGDAVTVLPINMAVSDERVLFRTADDTSLAAAGDGTTVTFEADRTDPVAESGWSVMVRGRMWDVTDRRPTATWRDVPVTPWAPGPRDRWMMIEPTLVTGRTIQRHRILPPGVRVPYMAPD